MRSASIAASAECIVESDARLPHHDARGYPLGWMSYFCCAGLAGTGVAAALTGTHRGDGSARLSWEAS